MPRNMTTTAPQPSTPPWMGDFGGRLRLVPGGAKVDPTQFAGAFGALLTFGAAAAAATVLPITTAGGTPVAIPTGTVIDAGGGKFARLTAPAVVGAASLTVQALPTAFVGGETAVYGGPAGSVKSLPSGTIVGRTIAERNAGTPFGAAISTDDEIFIVAFDVPDITQVADIELYRDGIVKENFLPGYANLAPALLTALRARYTCVRGAD
jgi:hypothetical protein